MVVDLHTHTTASDGSLSPLELVSRAREKGVTLLSVTDHDTVDAYQELRDVDLPGIQLVPGIELSCQWSGVNIHVLGLGIDPDDAGLTEQLQRQRQRRSERAELIAQRLEKLGIKDCYAGASRLAEGRAIGRPDFARYMVEAGYVDSMNAAFDKYLGAGKAGDVKAVWPELAEVVEWINSAGGIAVLAHPMQYKMTNAKLRRLLDAFCECGGGGLEVANGRPPLVEQRYLRQLCKEYGLEASIGSDFHQPNNWLELGTMISSLGDCIPVWRRWSQAAADATVKNEVIV